MRRAALITVLAVAAAALAGAYANAHAAPHSTAAARPNPLAKKVAVLSTQVKTLQKQMKATRAELNNTEIAFVLLQVCSTEVTADAIQGTWTTIDQLAARSGSGFFGSQTAVTDPISRQAGQELCSALNVTRQSVLAQPSTAAIQSLLNALGPARAGGTATSGALRKAVLSLQRGG
jgi:outer membrane murein-binding lipoprotein Lpp